MKKLQGKAFRGFAGSASMAVLALAIATPALAQEEDTTQAVEAKDGICSSDADGNPIPGDPDCVSVDAPGTPTADAEGGIIVTGSRIKKTTYSSPSPLQVLTTETENEAGMFDPSQILQRSESATGQQIDATFQGFVLDNGPGSQTLNLRGLGADRTLLLINGRRLAPSGVEGAPTSPSLNLLPSTLIERYDLLLDGASSVYGSDAVAGVGNIILRKDFDGLEVTGSGNINPMGGGDDYTIGASWGFNTDRAFFGIGAEYSYRDAIRLRDRKFFQGCDTNYEVDQNGNILTVGLADNAAVLEASGGTISVSESPCKITGISGRIFQPYARFGSVYYPANGNIANIPGMNYGESNNAFGQPLDVNNDGIRDVDFQNVNTNGANPDQTFLSQQKLYNVMAYGEYTFEGAANITPYFEAMYSRAEINSDNSGSPQIFPSVPDLNQFNPCNFLTNPDGVDCRVADNALQGITGTSLALPTGYTLPTTPIAAIQGDRDNYAVTQEMYRGVFGVKGDLPFIGSSWSFDSSLVYSKSKGKSVRRGIREDKLALALGIDPTGDFNGDGIVDNNGNGIADDYDNNYDVFGGDPLWIGECNSAALANPGLAMADLTQGCVPVNLFSANVLGSPIGSLTQAEADYVFGLRTFDTTYEQITASAYVTGDLIQLPAGPLSAVFGVEWRKDKINSQPDLVASDGLFFGFFSDQGAQGSKWIREAFGELDIPIVAGKPGFEELNLNLSGRITDEEFYGTNYTYSIKGLWRPVSPLALKFSYGTSFRAPNLRENFLKGQSGFLTLFDPCAVPDAAFSSTTGYDPTLDQRDPVVLQNCLREGRDPTRVGIDNQGLNTNAFQSVEISTGGSLDINPERSSSLTAGFAFEETFGDGFDVSLAFSYFDIKLKDSIVEPSSQFIINDCFTRSDGVRSQYCDRLTYDTDPATRLLVSSVASGFINLNKERVRGIDLNATFGKEVNMFGTNIDFGFNLRANHLIERSTTSIDDSGNATYNDYSGQFGLPKWTGRGTFTADVEKFRFTWQVSYTGPVNQDPDGVDPLSDAFGYGPDGTYTGFIGDTCLGGGSRDVNGVPDGIVPGDGVWCRDVGFAKAQFLHSASIRYRTDRYTFLVGVSNIFNTAPPLVDSDEVLAIANTAIGNGYNYDGREFFAQFRVNF